MINTDTPDGDSEVRETRIDEIVAGGPQGAIVVAGIATAIVIAMWILFYLMVFVPRGGV